MQAHILILNIERERYNAVSREQRIGTIYTCNRSEIDDELRFILQCPVYSELSVHYIKPYYYHRISVFKLVQLFISKNVKDLSNLSKYLLNATNKNHMLLT